jgi:hypothetical protein
MALTRNDYIIAVIFSILLFGLIGGIIFYSAFSNLGTSWPPINNPSILLQECKPLLRDYPAIIKDVNWPESIKQLSPVDVIGHKNFVDITISGGGIGPANGYLVYPDGRLTTTDPYGYIVKGSVSPGIFKYLTKE